FKAYPDWAAIEAGLKGGAAAYLKDIGTLAEQAATPWHSHGSYGDHGARFAPADESFRHVYGEMAL
ncbi:MAG: tagatose-bisphosphate aldolase, partial [Pseudomonadota bacterium]